MKRQMSSGLLLWFLCLLVTYSDLTLAESSGALTGFVAFAQDPAMSDAAVSPDGRHIATIQRLQKDGKPFLMIYDVDDMSAKPVTLGSGKMDINAFRWANNERLVVVFRQDVDTLQEELEIDTRLVYKLATIDKKGKRWLEIPRKRADRRRELARMVENFSNAAILDELPWDEEHILIEYDDDANGVSDIFKVNVATGSTKLVARNNNRIEITHVDEDGDPRLAVEFDESDEALIYYARKKGSKKWIEIGRTVAGLENNSKEFNAFRLHGDADSNEFYVLSNHETDTTGIYLYDLDRQTMGELLFLHPKYDATGLRTRLDKNRRPQTVGFTFSGKGRDVYLTDSREKSLYQAIDLVLPDRTNQIVSRSDDDAVIIIRSDGPKHPPAWYLLKDGRIDLLGQSMPFLTEDMLSDVEWVSYVARDGLRIPALVTLPQGAGPFPIVVHPHGGPVARDLWGFDLWAQLMAHHGYVVIQPQFRISDGFGREHLEAGYARWGHEMQDDLDDAIAYLARRGIGDPKRTAIFGWSYGGYAAFVGSFRDPNPYQCAIAGAGVADVPYFRAWLADFGTFSEKTYRPTVDGINPLDHVASVDIPILVIHGDIDERVPVQESRKFVRELKKHNKQHKYIELEDANHFFGTIYYRHWMEMFPALIDWMDNTCRLKTPRG